MSSTGLPIRLSTHTPSRSAKAALALYDGARGALLTDGYEYYAAVARAHNLVHLGCWAHARHAFVEAETALPKASGSPDHLATQFIAAIGELYAVEAQWRDAEPARQTVEERWRMQQETSMQILERIEALLLANLHAAMLGSLLGRALHYLSGQWSKLVRYVEDGRYLIDNTPARMRFLPSVERIGFLERFRAKLHH
jgi:hypothetical protein